MRALITGANRGIGRALFDQMQARGDEVKGTARSAADFLQLDVTQAKSVDALASALDSQPLDLLVCNAGVYPDRDEKLADGYPPEMWAEGFATNVTGVFLTIQALLPNLQLGTNPRIAIISSQMASHTRAPGGSYIYRASKAAALNVGRNLATDLKPLDISVGVYHPGWVRTDMGGPRADLDVDEAAKGLIARFDALSVGNTGCFENWDGRPHPY